MVTQPHRGNLGSRGVSEAMAVAPIGSSSSSRYRMRLGTELEQRVVEAWREHVPWSSVPEPSSRSQSSLWDQVGEIRKGGTTS